MRAGGRHSGAALGIALVGSLATAIYRSQLAVPADVPAATSAAARESVMGATDAAAGLPAGPAAQLLDSAREAFSSGLTTTALVGTVIFGALAALALTVLRPAEVQRADQRCTRPRETTNRRQPSAVER